MFNGLENFEGCKLDPTGEYYIMTLNDTNYFTTDGKIFSIGVYVNDFDFNHTFKFEYRTQTNSNINDFYELVKGEEPKHEEELGEAIAYAGVKDFPARIKCATLAWKAIEKAIDEVNKNE